MGDPAVPEAVALMVPPLRIGDTAASWSMRTALLCAVAKFPPAALTVPEIGIVGTDAAAPMREAVAVAPSDLPETLR